MKTTYRTAIPLLLVSLCLSPASRAQQVSLKQEIDRKECSKYALIFRAGVNMAANINPKRLAVKTGEFGGVLAGFTGGHTTSHTTLASTMAPVGPGAIWSQVARRYGFPPAPMQIQAGNQMNPAFYQWLQSFCPSYSAELDEARKALSAVKQKQAVQLDVIKRYSLPLNDPKRPTIPQVNAAFAANHALVGEEKAALSRLRAVEAEIAAAGHFDNICVAYAGDVTPPLPAWDAFMISAPLVTQLDLPSLASAPGLEQGQPILKMAVKSDWTYLLQSDTSRADILKMGEKSSAKAWNTSSFRVEIPGYDCSKAVAVSAISLVPQADALTNRELRDRRNAYLSQVAGPAPLVRYITEPILVWTQWTFERVPLPGQVKSYWSAEDLAARRAWQEKYDQAAREYDARQSTPPYHVILKPGTDINILLPLLPAGANPPNPELEGLPRRKNIAPDRDLGSVPSGYLRILYPDGSPFMDLTLRKPRVVSSFATTGDRFTRLVVNCESVNLDFHY